MANSTSITYRLKRKILTFTNKVSCRLPKPDRKFMADMVYGILASRSCLLTDISDQLHETTRKVNTVTFDAIKQAAALFGKATFVMDRGYDDNKIFLMLDHLKQDYVIRLKSNRKLLYHNEWTKATELRNRRKGKVKAEVFYKGKEHTAYLSHVKVQITASRKNIYLVLVYGITEHPMMLATNKEIRSKHDVIRIARTYFSRWRIEEYFRCKKQTYQFENFRVRRLEAINALNFYITLRTRHR